MDDLCIEFKVDIDECWDLLEFDDFVFFEELVVGDCIWDDFFDVVFGLGSFVIVGEIVDFVGYGVDVVCEYLEWFECMGIVMQIIDFFVMYEWNQEYLNWWCVQQFWNQYDDEEFFVFFEDVVECDELFVEKFGVEFLDVVVIVVYVIDMDCFVEIVWWEVLVWKMMCC